MDTRFIIVLLLVLVAGLGVAVAYTLNALVVLKKAVRRVDLETHLLSEKLDYLRRELEKLDPDRYAPKSDWAVTPAAQGPIGSSAWAPPGANSTATLVIDPALLEDARPLPGDRPETSNEPPLRLPLPRVAEAAISTPAPRSELLPDLKPLVDLLPENMREPEEEPSVLPGSGEPESVHAHTMSSVHGTPLRSRTSQWLHDSLASLREGLAPAWKWFCVTSGPDAGGNYEAVALVWLIRGTVLTLGFALTSLMVSLVPAMEPEYVTVLGCVAGIACLSLAVTMVDRGAGALGRLLAIGGLIMTALSMFHGAWVSGVVPVGWALGILSVGALATTMAGERNHSLLLTGAGMAAVFALPLILIMQGESVRVAAALCVLLSVLAHAIISPRAWILLRILSLVYGYIFIASCTVNLDQPLRGPVLGALVGLLFVAQHGVVLFGPQSMPQTARQGSFWLGVTALFLFVCLELTSMFQGFGHLRSLVLTFVLLMGTIMLLERYNHPAQRDRATSLAMAICLTVMAVKQVLDFAPWQPALNLIFNSPYSLYEAAVRCLALIMVTAAFLMTARRLSDSVPRVTLALNALAFVGAFVYATLEVNTYLHVNLPGFQGAGLSLLWGLIGVLMTMAGVAIQRPLLSQFGGLFLGVMVIKLLAVDMRQMADMLQRVVSLVGVGLLLLTGALPYFRRQRAPVDHAPSALTDAPLKQEPEPDHAP